MQGFRLEIAVGTTAFVALVIGAVVGVSPQDRTFLYAISAAMILLGLLLAKYTYLCCRSGRVLGILFAVLSVLLIIVGTLLGHELYRTTPIDMGGHIL